MAENPEEEYERFSMMLECNNSACGEVVVVSGDIYSQQEEDYQGNIEWVDYYDPASMYPAPPIFEINPRVPQAVVDEIDLSFQSYWTDYGIAASRLRTSMERLMDHFKVPKYRISRRNPNRPGKRVPLDLSARIDKFASKINTQAYSEMLHALRVVGNLGAHGERVKRSKMLDAYQLYEMALNQMFEDKRQTAKAIIKRLKAKR